MDQPTPDDDAVVNAKVGYALRYGADTYLRVDKLLDANLVIAGRFPDQTPLDMLRRLDVTAARFTLVADDLGLTRGAVLPLEPLAMSDPDAVITGQPDPAVSRTEEILDHPVVAHLKRDSMRGIASDQDWSCGTPLVLDAIERLTQARRAATGAGR